MASERRPSKAPPVSDEHRVVSGKKDTKRWCRGKIGVEHAKAWVLDRRYERWPTYRGWYTFQCTECGRQFDYCTEYTGRLGKCKCGHHGDGK